MRVYHPIWLHLHGFLQMSLTRVFLNYVLKFEILNYFFICRFLLAMGDIFVSGSDGKLEHKLVSDGCKRKVVHATIF